MTTAKIYFSGDFEAAGIQLRITINFHNSWLSHVTRWNFDEKCNFFLLYIAEKSALLLFLPQATLYHSPLKLRPPGPTTKMMMTWLPRWCFSQPHHMARSKHYLVWLGPLIIRYSKPLKKSRSGPLLVSPVKLNKQKGTLSKVLKTSILIAFARNN